jgi:hypothetical protein
MLRVHIIHVPGKGHRRPNGLGDYEGVVEGNAEKQGTQGAALLGSVYKTRLGM